MTTSGDAPADGAGVEAERDEAAAAHEIAGPDASTIAALEAEKSDLKDRLMRALADSENMRRRAERDVADARTYAVTNFARDMLTVADNIRRALETAPRSEEGQVADVFKPLIEGIELTERDLLATLTRHGVKLLRPEGQKFDPNMHQAMFEVPSTEVPSGTVVQVIQSGYAIADRVLRPALVGVAKGGPKPATAGPSDAGAAEAAGR